jgi:hypothetical protein
MAYNYEISTRVTGENNPEKVLEVITNVLGGDKNSKKVLSMLGRMSFWYRDNKASTITEAFQLNYIVPEQELEEALVLWRELDKVLKIEVS